MATSQSAPLQQAHLKLLTKLLFLYLENGLDEAWLTDATSLPYPLPLHFWKTLFKKTAQLPETSVGNAPLPDTPLPTTSSSPKTPKEHMFPASLSSSITLAVEETVSEAAPAPSSTSSSHPFLPSAKEEATLAQKLALLRASNNAIKTTPTSGEPMRSQPMHNKQSHDRAMTDTILKDPLYAQLKQCNTLKDLYNFMASFEGCALKNAALNTVTHDGCKDALIMLIGEAPGAEEDRLGKPFVGRSGQLLDKMLEAIGLSRHNTDNNSVYITNIVPWRPPANRTPTDAEIRICLPLIERHISLVRPTLLLLMGSTAMRALLNLSQGITQVRGNFYPYKNPFLDKEIQVLPTFHPAYLLRSPAQKRHSWEDMKKVREIKEFHVKTKQHQTSHCVG